MLLHLPILPRSAFFCVVWVLHASPPSGRLFGRLSLTPAMNGSASLDAAMARRELRMIDTGDHASACSRAPHSSPRARCSRIGGCFALSRIATKCSPYLSDLPSDRRRRAADLRVEGAGLVAASSPMPSSSSAGPTGCSTTARS